MKAKRIMASLFAIGVGLLFATYFADMEWRGMPVAWAGYVAIVIGALGLLGVNVFIGGPLDKRNDQAD